MTLKDVEMLTRHGENGRLEFKKKANHPDKIVKEVVAFANTRGGQLMLGVDDDGTTSGVRNIDGEAFLVEKAIRELVRPSLSYQLEMIPVNAKKGLAVFHISESQRKPHFVKDAPHIRKGTAFVRHNDESVKASREMREIMQRRLKNKDVQFTYGEKERVLMAYLDENRYISLQEFSRLAKIPKYFASRTLIRLVLANVLDILPQAGKDLYFLKPRKL